MFLGLKQKPWKRHMGNRSPEWYGTLSWIKEDGPGCVDFRCCFISHCWSAPVQKRELPHPSNRNASPHERQNRAFVGTPIARQPLTPATATPALAAIPDCANPAQSGSPGAGDPEPAA